MKETTHNRSRRASLLGLLIQIAASGSAYGLAFYTSSAALGQLTWLLVAGIPVWFVALLVFRQYELAKLEEFDLEELRREKRKVGASEGLFNEEEGGLGFMVAKARLDWMERWLVPAFSLLVGVMLVGIGVWQWFVLQRLSGPDFVWGGLVRVEVGLVLSTMIALVLFFYARYAAGMARVPDWRLLRACGSMMLAGAIVSMAITVALGAAMYTKSSAWERAVGWAVPVLMVVLGAEMLMNFLLDIYRPRIAGVERRAALDSRLVGLVSEPGGIAKSLADAINYQFGFQVSQTWFYQLLQRALAPLFCVALLTLWLMTSIVFIQPYERAIVLRFGKQMNADDPLGPGLYFKRPWPFETVEKYNTGQLHQFMVGFRVGESPETDFHPGKPEVEQWTDEKHLGREHYNFLISPPASELAPATEEVRAARSERAPVNMIRLTLLVQYRLREDRLASLSQNWFVKPRSDTLDAPHQALRDLAWDETLRLTASTDVDALMGPVRDAAAENVRRNLQARVDELDLGMDVVYTGLLNLHPEKSVAEAFRSVVDAQQEKIAEIRKARVTENEILSKVAGDREVALSLARSIRQLNSYQDAVNRAEVELAEAGIDTENALRAFESLEEDFDAEVEAAWRLDLARFELGMVREDYEQASGGTLRGVQDSEEHVRNLEGALAERQQAFADKTSSILSRIGAHGPAAERMGRAQAGVRFWTSQLERNLRGLEGEAAVVLAEARARRWELEMKAASELTRLENERSAYKAAPRIFQARRYLAAIVKGIGNSRKYFLAFDPEGRDVRIRLEAQEAARPDVQDMSLESAK